MPPPPTAASGVLHTYLQLLAEAYRRTLQLADKLHDAGGADVKTKARLRHDLNDVSADGQTKCLQAKQKGRRAGSDRLAA